MIVNNHAIIVEVPISLIIRLIIAYSKCEIHYICICLIFNTATGFKRITSSSCEAHGMHMITTKLQCEVGAKALRLSYTNVYYSKYGDEFRKRPCGCLYNRPNFLHWNPQTDGYCRMSTACGSFDYFYSRDCICSSQGTHLQLKLHS